MASTKTTESNLFGLYVHWPYCIHKCPYCDFASTVCSRPDEELLLKTYVRDMTCFPDNRPLTSLFFGGGTPSLMSLSFFEKLMNAIRQHYHFAPEIEISMEANPDTVDKNKLKGFHDLGINRLSIGVQSLTEKDLKFLGRTHTVQRAISCIEEAQNIFDNINIDLIYARPNQSLKAWEQELLHALQFDLPHYSLYQLTIEENTVFDRKGQKAASDIQARRLYKLTDEIMAQHKRPAYEVSNYAKRDFKCRHNMTYWLGCDYIGIGPAAHGRLGLVATENSRSVPLWIKTNPHTETLSTKERNLEKLLMGLRLRHHGFPSKNISPQKIQKAASKGWIQIDKDKIIPTQEGILMLNQLILLLAD